MASNELALAANSATNDLKLYIGYAIAPLHESMVITASVLDPTIDRRNDSVYKNTLFARDDQIFDTLASGISARSARRRRKVAGDSPLRFNLDHGGGNGGLKVLVDDVQQNQSTQGHGQSYLGALKTLTPELVDDVDILNGPCSAAYGEPPDSTWWT